MKFKIGLLISIFTFCMNHVLAEEGFVANGGDIILCASNNPFKTRLLDYHERQVLFPETKYDFGENSLSVNEKVHRIIDRVGRFDLNRAATYRKYFSSFFDEVIFTEDDLEDVPDSNHVSIPSGCGIKQIVIQFSDGFNVPGKRYLIDLKLWNQIDDNTKAGLILHELIYRGAIETGHKNSIATRAFNAYIVSVLYNHITEETYYKFLIEYNLSEVERYPGLIIDRSEKIWYSDEGRILKAQFKPGSSIQMFGQDIILSNTGNSIIEFVRGEPDLIQEIEVVDESDFMIFESDYNSFKTQKMKIYSKRGFVRFDQHNDFLNIFGKYIDLSDRENHLVEIRLNINSGTILDIFMGGTRDGLNHQGEVLFSWNNQDLIVGLSKNGNIFGGYGIFSLEFFSSNLLKSGWIKNDFIQLRSGKSFELWKYQESDKVGSSHFGVIGFSGISFYETGEIREFYPKKAVFKYKDLDLNIVSGFPIMLNKNEEIIKASVWSDFRFELNNGNVVKVLGRRTFELYDDLSLKSASTDPNDELLDINNLVIRCEDAEFNKQGYVIKCDKEEIKY